MTEDRKYAILFGATLLSARKLIEMELDKPNMGKGYVVDMAIEDAAFILRGSMSGCLQNWQTTSAVSL